MPKGKKKFIDRKNAVTFHLVHRSQQDPLIVDETAPQHVLVQAPGKKSKEDFEKRKEEQRKYGIYFDDDYDYLQHLKEVSNMDYEWQPTEYVSSKKEKRPVKKETEGQELETEDKKLCLPSSVFASEVEEEVGLLNKAAPESGLRLDLDPDIVAAMDDDFDFEDPENQLEDNFVELANADRSDSEDGEYDTDDLSSNGESMDEEENDEVCSLNSGLTFGEEETKSRFTNYSMSSSVIRRNEQLSLLDCRFEKMFTEYDESEIGALDCEEIEGHVAPNSEVLLQCVKEFEEEKTSKLNDVDKTLQILERLSSDSEDSDDLVKMEIKEKEQEKWDCESILSTYSNIYNHPKLIPDAPSKRIRVSGRTGIPLEVLGSNNGKLTPQSLAKFDAANRRSTGDQDGTESVLSTLSVLSIRSKDETPEQRRERKKALKDYRKERRLERKANTLAFKEEKKRQEKVMLNNRMNQQGVKII